MACLFSLSLCIFFCSLSYPLSLDFAFSLHKRGKNEEWNKNKGDSRGVRDSQSVCSTQQVMILSTFHHDKSCRGVDTGRDSRYVWIDECFESGMGYG